MTLPSIWGGNRRGYILRLIAYGLGSGALWYVLARFVRHGLIHDQHSQHVWALSVGILVLTAAHFGLRVFEAMDAEGLGQSYLLSVRKRLLKATLADKGSKPDPSRLGITLSRFITDLNSLKNWVSLGFARRITASVRLIATWVALLFLDPSLAAILLGVIALWLVASHFLAKELRTRVQFVRKQRGRLSNEVVEELFSAKATRLLGQNALAISTIAARGRKLRDAVIRRTTISTMLRRTSDLAYGIALLGVFWRFTSSSHPHSDLFAALILISSLAASLRELSRAQDYQISFEQSRQRLRLVLRQHADTPDNLPILPKPLPRRRPASIRFDAVQIDIHHQPISFNATAGELISLVGNAGSGKTALLRASSFLIHPLKGQILLEGLPLNQIEQLHRIIQLVSPELPLVHGTVLENLKRSAPGTSEARLKSVDARIGFSTRPHLFPQGLESTIEPLDGRLSSTSLALVRLGRALLTRASIYLVDEPSLWLDPEASEILRTACLQRSATWIVVTPRSIDPGPAFRRWDLSAQNVVPEPDRAEDSHRPCMNPECAESIPKP